MALLALAVTLRLHAIGAWPLWYDELCSVLRADGRSEYADPEKGVAVPKIPLRVGPPGGLMGVVDCPRDNHPPLYFLALRGWRALFGESPGALRGLSALASLIALGCGAALAWTLGGARAGLFALLLLGVAPLEVEYAQEARAYAFLSAAGLIATLALARLEADEGALTTRARLGWWAVYALGIASGLASHYIGVVTPLAHVAYWLLSRRAAPPPAIARSTPPPPAADTRPPPGISRLPLALAATALLLLPLGVLVLGHLAFTFQAPTGPLRFVSATRAGGFLEARAHIPATLASLLAQLALGTRAQVTLGAMVAATLLALVWRGCAGAPRARLVALTALAGPLVLLGIEVATAGGRLGVARYALACSGALPVAAALGLARLQGVGLAGALTILLLGSASGLATLKTAPAKAEDFGRVASLMNARGCDVGDVVILALVWQEQALELNQLLPGAPSQVIVWDALDRSVLERPWRHVYLVVTDARRKAGDGLRGFIGAQLPEREALRAHGVTVVRFSLGD